MSIVQYVVYGSARAADGAMWDAILDALRADGFDPTYETLDLPRSLSLVSGAAGVLINFETRESNGALEPQAWPAHLRAGLEQRANSIFIQATGDTDDFAFFGCIATHLAAYLDGWIYNECANELVDAYGNSPSTATGDDADPEVAIDWSMLPSPAAGPFTIVFRWDRVPSLYQLDNIVHSLDDGLHRNGGIFPDGRKRPDSARWPEAAYTGACGECLKFTCMNPGRLPAYVRLTFDVDEMLTPRDAASMSELVALAKRLVPAIRQQLGFPIDVEP